MKEQLEKWLSELKLSVYHDTPTTDVIDKLEEILTSAKE